MPARAVDPLLGENPGSGTAEVCRGRRQGSRRRRESPGRTVAMRGDGEAQCAGDRGLQCRGTGRQGGAGKHRRRRASPGGHGQRKEEGSESSCKKDGDGVP
eukprot:151689-Heterocapsa_arctica.AAC.1